MKNVGQRIEEVREELGITKTKIWKGAGLTSGIYSQWLDGSKLSAENLYKVSKILGVNPSWLQTGKGEKYLNQQKNVIAEITSNAIDLPLLNVAGSMGSGNHEPDQELVIDMLRVTKTWVDKSLGNISSLSNLAFIHAIGDSMAPTFNDGDILLVDTGNKEPRADNIYVLKAHGRLFIKRIRQRLDGSYEVSSDNPSVKTVDILNGDHEVMIMGRIVWVWNGRKI